MGYSSSLLRVWIVASAGEEMHSDYRQVLFVVAGRLSSCPFFFVQRSGQTRTVERSRRHPLTHCAKAVEQLRIINSTT